MSLSSQLAEAKSSPYRSAFHKVERFWGLLLCTPYMVGLLVFAVGPILFSLMLGFFEWNSIGTPKFVGLQNWQRLFTDPLFRKAFFNTVFFVVGTVPTGVFLSLVLAVLLLTPKRLQSFYRSVYFLPVVTSNVAIALVWSWFYDSNYGVLNYVIESCFKLVGATPPDPVAWLNDPRTALPAIMVMTVWKGLGYNMVIFLAALQGVPKSLYEAAEIDGANVVQKFFYITVPSIAPVIFFVVVISTITGFQVFEQVYIMARDGRPADSTMTIVYYLYKSAFTNGEMGYASTIGTMLFLIIFVVIVAQLYIQRLWTGNHEA